MANFNTHLNVAVVTTGLASATLLSAEHVNLTSALCLWFLGSIGGLLPDVDSDNSTSLDTLFNLLAISAVLIVIRYITAQDFRQISLAELIALPLLFYVVMRYLIRPIFEKITIHRGSCHSLLFLILVALMTMQAVWRLTPNVTEQSIIIAWLSGGFILMGGLIHLILDELYSVDLGNIRIKRSFGTALKIADFNNKIITFLTLVSIIALGYTAPSPSQTVDTLSSWSKLNVMPATDFSSFLSR